MSEESKRQNLFKRFWVGLKNFLILISGKIKRVWEHPLSYLNAYSTALVAIATLGLVYVTYMHVGEAKNMRNLNQQMLKSAVGQLKEARKVREETKKLAEATYRMSEETKRLADISIEQFKIKSYPALELYVDEPYINSSIISEKSTFQNKGEITAINVRILKGYAYNKRYAYNKEGTLLFKPILVNQYEDPVGRTIYQAQSTFFYERNMVSQDIFIHGSQAEWDDSFRLDTLKHLLYFVRFKVPYDEKYRYETYVFRLKRKLRDEKTAPISYMWEIEIPFDRDKIAKKFVTYIRGLLAPEITIYSKDAQLPESLKPLQIKSENIKEMKDFFVDYIWPVSGSNSEGFL